MSGLLKNSHSMPPSEKDMGDFFSAATAGNKKGVEAFLDKYPDCIDETIGSGYTALTWAAFKGRLDIVEMLLAKGASMEVCGSLHRTPLMCAAREGHLGIMTVLLEKGAGLDTQSHGGWTALMYAAWSGKIDTVRMLLEMGADIDLKNSTDDTARLIALRSRHAETAELLKIWPEMERRRRAEQALAEELEMITKTIMGGLPKAIPYKSPFRISQPGDTP